MSAPRPRRPITTEELVAAFAGSLQTLANRCDEFSDQVAAAVAREDKTQKPSFDFTPIGGIAAQLRLLLGNGQGDDVLRRVCGATKVPVPSVALGAEAALPKRQWDKVVVSHFSMGAIPDSAHPAGRAPISEIWGGACLALIDRNHAGDVLMTWGELVKEIADKNAVHLDSTRPVAWDHIDEYHIGEVPAIPFLLYRLAITVLAAGNELLRSVGATEVPIAATEELGGMRCEMVAFSETSEQPNARRPGRNDLCPCGSGSKFKRCCGQHRATYVEDAVQEAYLRGPYGTGPDGPQ